MGLDYEFKPQGRNLCVKSRGKASELHFQPRGKKLIIQQYEERMDGRMDGRTDGRTDGRADGRMDGWMDGRTDGLRDGPMDGWTDTARCRFI